MDTPIDKKLWPLLILKVLERHADEGEKRNDDGERFLTQKQILGFLKSDFGVITQRKAVADNLARLHEAGMVCPELGFELDFLEGERCGAKGSPEGDRILVHEGWRLTKDRDFNASEVRMLVDTVIASPVIPPRQTKDLVERLKGLSGAPIVVPAFERDGFHSFVNHDFFLNIELLNEAIQQGKMVRFALGMLGQDGKLRKRNGSRRNGEHSVVPVQLLISGGHYYLLAHYPGNEKTYQFRIDLLMGVCILEKDEAQGQGAANVNVGKYRDQHSYMMSGEVLDIELRIAKDSFLPLYDQFGPNLHFKNEQADTIDVTLKSTMYSVFFWALQYYRSVEVLSPCELRTKLAQAGQTIADRYSGEPGDGGFTEERTNGGRAK